MQLRFIDRNTKMEIEMLASPNVASETGEETFDGVFVDSEKSTDFFFTCDAIVGNLKEFSADQYWKFSFYRGDQRYAFSGKIISAQIQGGREVLLAASTSLLEKNSPQKSPRIIISIPLTVYHAADENEEQTGSIFCTGKMIDVSSGGISFITQSSIEVKREQQYIAEFTISGSRFRMPITFIRSWAAAHAYKETNHSFMFSKDVCPEEVKRLTVALFEYRLKGGR